MIKLYWLRPNHKGNDVTRGQKQKANNNSNKGELLATMHTQNSGIIDSIDAHHVRADAEIGEWHVRLWYDKAAYTLLTVTAAELVTNLWSPRLAKEQFDEE